MSVLWGECCGGAYDAGDAGAEWDTGEKRERRGSAAKRAVPVAGVEADSVAADGSVVVTEEEVEGTEAEDNYADCLKGKEALGRLVG